MSEMELITRQEPGLVEFYNFEELKTNSSIHTSMPRR